MKRNRIGGALVSLLTAPLGLMAVMAIADANTVAQKWASRAGSAGADYQAGVEGTDKDPTALAIANGQRYINGVADAFQSGRWANGLRRVGKAGWQQAVKEKGVTNFTNGVRAAESKFAERIAPVLQFESALQGRIRSMPNVTDADREARAIAWIRGMREYKTGR